MRDDAENFDFNPIKLVEASPGAILRQSVKKPAHNDKVHGAGAVEDETLDREGLREVLDGFCFPRARRPGRSTPEFLVKSVRHRQVTLVRQTGHDQTRTVAQVFVGVTD